MPARDYYHDIVRSALIADGWTTTDDPLLLKWVTKDHFVDLAERRLLVGDKASEKVAVAVKSFSGPSDMDDPYEALGQFTLYHGMLQESDPDRILYLAVPRKVVDELFHEPIGQLLLERERIRLISFDPDVGVIVQWIPCQRASDRSTRGAHGPS
jgi:hypothetical protein